MARGGAGNMLGVGGTRQKLGRKALRGGGRDGRAGAHDAQAQKRELLRRLQERNGRDGNEKRDGEEKRDGKEKRD